MSSNEEMDYDNEEDSSDDTESSNYYGLGSIPCAYPTVSYSPRKTDNKNETPIGLPLRKSIMVGSSYQATIPELLKKPPYSDKRNPYSGEDRLLWSPNKLTDDAVKSYLTTVQRINLERARGIAAIPLGAHTRDDEQALLALSQCGYNVDKTTQRLQSTPSSPNHAAASYWTEEECKSFESGIRIYGKEFFLIHTNKVKTRSVGELVQFYYLWKKTERHDVFANRVKLDKKKYSLHPGVTFLEDHDESSSYKDGTFTNIQCLIYGDAKKFHRGTDLTNHAFYENAAIADPNRNNKASTNHVSNSNSQT